MGRNGEPWRTQYPNLKQRVSLPNSKNPPLENTQNIRRLANISEAPKRRSAMSQFGKATHKKVARSIGYALTLGTPCAWNKLSLILLARLSKKERAGLTYAALMSLDKDTAYEVATLAVFGVAKGERVQ
ncbi:hypothetical protein [Pseudophaeobacter flagellatus]|uniref:hypothetical protein n=1 Tax=Pseudophaeobacter flagellatus TaxID=2899119 RepID=UPI001E3EBE1A|nr:hypothetical protein [Pseudophaeobacter flagellatus]MCD9148684.1 hypothetical protein [Pseudophaeobacter flagellatus]